ncbi:M1 family metallopeptidase [Streptomyces sp. NPDC054796]
MAITPPGAVPTDRPPRPASVRTLRRRFGTAGAVAATALALVAADLPAPRALGIGDRLFPELGNPGYDVSAYDIALRYGGDNTKPLEARTVIEARVTSRSLSRVNLDFAGGQVRSVRVNGDRAAYTGRNEDLVLTPEDPLYRGQTLRIEVRHTSPVKGVKGSGWVRTSDGLAMANQADAAHRVFPCNDHPSDKARFTFRVTAPRKLTAVAGGELTGKRREGAATTWTYESAHPMATELAQVSVGRSAVLRRQGPHGLPVRDVVPRGDAAKLEPWLAKTPEQIAWMERRAGPYPFENYGLLVADAQTGFELETQTLSLFERHLFTSPDYPSWYKESVMVHELAHQWFGNSVSPRTWGDLWLNEGHATWYEWAYAQKAGGFPVERRVRAAYRESDAWREKYGPPAALRTDTPDGKIGIFRSIVYDGSAVVLYALRQKLGAEDFARLERLWVSRHQDGNADTADFIAMVNEVAGRDLTGFMKGWLYGEKTPPMPGHPKWRAA